MSVPVARTLHDRRRPELFFIGAVAVATSISFFPALVGVHIICLIQPIAGGVAVALGSATIAAGWPRYVVFLLGVGIVLGSVGGLLLGAVMLFNENVGWLLWD